MSHLDVTQVTEHWKVAENIQRAETAGEPVAAKHFCSLLTCKHALETDHFRKSHSNADVFCQSSHNALSNALAESAVLLAQCSEHAQLNHRDKSSSSPSLLSVQVIQGMHAAAVQVL